MRYGYVRVSTKEQNIERQLVVLSMENITTERIFVDRASGKDFNRVEYRNLLNVLKSGDELVIKSIDRLGRNYDEILEQWRILTKRKNVNITVLDSITAKLISDLVLQILSYVSQIEREQTKQRQMEGIRVARKKGIKFGRPELRKPKNLHLILEKYRKKELTIREGAKILGVSKSTFHNWSKKF